MPSRSIVRRAARAVGITRNVVYGGDIQCPDTCSTALPAQASLTLTTPNYLWSSNKRVAPHIVRTWYTRVLWPYPSTALLLSERVPFPTIRFPRCAAPETLPICYAPTLAAPTA